MNREYINWINDRIDSLDPSGSYGRGIEYGLMLARDKYLDAEADKIIDGWECEDCPKDGMGAPPRNCPKCQSPNVVRSKNTISLEGSYE